MEKYDDMGFPVRRVSFPGVREGRHGVLSRLRFVHGMSDPLPSGLKSDLVLQYSHGANDGVLGRKSWGSHDTPNLHFWDIPQIAVRR